ncbi:MAG TPA: heavy metal-binding domain-containing protein [Streptosporangiaceae bacterium]
MDCPGRSAGCGSLLTTPRSFPSPAGGWADTSRNQARERMWRAARAKGANAVVAMRFDCNEIAGIMSEVAAYGTAVTVEPLELPHGNTDTQR